MHNPPTELPTKWKNYLFWLNDRGLISPSKRLAQRPLESSEEQTTTLKPEDQDVSTPRLLVVTEELSKIDTQIVHNIIVAIGFDLSNEVTWLFPDSDAPNSITKIPNILVVGSDSHSILKSFYQFDSIRINSPAKLFEGGPFLIAIDHPSLLAANQDLKRKTWEALKIFMAGIKNTRLELD
jgi:hypothetical protein